jgi:hypothetical protein
MIMVYGEQGRLTCFICATVNLTKLRWWQLEDWGGWDTFRMQELDPCSKLICLKSEGTWHVGQPKVRWLGSVEEDLKNMGLRNRRCISRSQEQWRQFWKGLRFAKGCNAEGRRRKRRRRIVTDIYCSMVNILYACQCCCSWYSFSLGAESTPGPWYGRKEICHWKVQWHHWESIPGPSD